MNALVSGPFGGALHGLSQGLLVPTVAVLLLLAAFAVYTLGSLVVEVVVERRAYRVLMPQLIADLDAASFGELPGVIERSGLLGTQRACLRQVVDYAYLPPDALTEVAKRALSAEADRYERSLWWTEAAVKVAPMLGLMGTLIPLGPGIVGLSSGDLATLSSSLLVAFDTTVAGLVVAVVCYLVTKARRRWYRGYLACVESGLSTILEKVELLRAEGFAFPRPDDGEGARPATDGDGGPCVAAGEEGAR